MRINDKHHAVVLFGLSEDVRKAGITSTDSRIRGAPGLDHIAFEVDSRQDWLLALDHVRSCGVNIVSGPYVHAPEGGEKGFVGGSGSHAFYFLDPDGNRIEDLLLDDDGDRAEHGRPAPRPVGLRRINWGELLAARQLARAPASPAAARAPRAATPPHRRLA